MMRWPRRSAALAVRRLPPELAPYGGPTPSWVGYVLEELGGWAALVDDASSYGYIAVPYWSWDPTISVDEMRIHGALPDRVQIGLRGGGVRLDLNAGELMFTEAPEVWARVGARLASVLSGRSEPPQPVLGRVLCERCGKRPAWSHGVEGWLCEDCDELYPRFEG